MKRRALLVPLFALATAGCFQEKTIVVPFVDPATNAPAATPAGKAERIRHAIEQLEYEVRGLDEELAKTDTARTAEETTAIKTRRDAIAQRIEQERRFLAGEGPDPSTPSPTASETHAENAETAEN